MSGLRSIWRNFIQYKFVILVSVLIIATIFIVAYCCGEYLKLFLIFLGIIVSALGEFVDYKTNNRLNTYGFFALVLFGSSMLGAIFLEYQEQIEVRKNKKEILEIKENLQLSLNKLNGVVNQEQINNQQQLKSAQTHLVLLKNSIDKIDSSLLKQEKVIKSQSALLYNSKSLFRPVTALGGRFRLSVDSCIEGDLEIVNKIFDSLINLRTKNELLFSNYCDEFGVIANSSDDLNANGLAFNFNCSTINEMVDNGFSHSKMVGYTEFYLGCSFFKTKDECLSHLKENNQSVRPSIELGYSLFPFKFRNNETFENHSLSDGIAVLRPVYTEWTRGSNYTFVTSLGLNKGTYVNRNIIKGFDDLEGYYMLVAAVSNVGCNSISIESVEIFSGEGNEIQLFFTPDKMGDKIIDKHGTVYYLHKVTKEDLGLE